MDIVQIANEVLEWRNVLYFLIGFFGCLILLKILEHLGIIKRRKKKDE